MAASTRIFLAVTALVVVVLVLYYGVFSSDSPGGPQIARATEDAESASKTGLNPGAADRPLATDLPPRVEAWPPPRSVRPQQEEPPVQPPALDLAQKPQKDDRLEDFAPVDLDASDGQSGGGGGGKDGPPLPPARDADDDAAQDTDEAPETEPEPEPEPEPREPDRPAPAPPAPSPAPAPGAEAPQYTNYTVKANDTMSTIAAEWFGDASKWDLIAKANPLVDPARIQPGQVVRLPPKDAKRDEPQEKAGDKPIEYTVRSGDTLSKIARNYYGHERHWQRIYDANKAAIGDNPGNLKPGMKLTIPPAPSEE